MEGIRPQSQALILRALSVGLCLLVMGCAIFPEPHGKYGVGHREIGVASWYGEPFHGRPTASGEIYDMYGLTAAHRVMPLGTFLKVTHVGNGKSVIVKANDRGPFIRGRILDLSYGAARVLGMTQEGTARVEIVVIETGRGRAGPFTVQVGSFLLKENAEDLSKKLSPRYSGVSVVPIESQGKTYYRVRVGNFLEERQAQKLGNQLKKKEGLQTFVTRREP